MIRTLLTHSIYEACINTFFGHLKKNFPNKVEDFYIGAHYDVIIDTANDVYYFDCEVIHPADLAYIEDLTYDGLNIADIALAIRFKAYKSGSDGILERFGIEMDDDGDDGDDEIHFEAYEMKDLVFKKKN
jgi:hypothetical protein